MRSRKNHGALPKAFSPLSPMPGPGRMRVRQYEAADCGQVIRLVSEFRRSVDAFRGNEHEADLDSAAQELEDWLRPGFCVFVAEHEPGALVGFIVCRVADGVVWAESMYTDPAFRRKGVGSMLFQRANELAKENKHDTVYGWVHPNNDVIIAFLRHHGYDVLNLIEVRRAHDGEVLKDSVTIMRNSFRY